MSGKDAHWQVGSDHAGIATQMVVENNLAKKEINLTGGEASQNPHIVEIYKIFRTLSDNVRLHTNLDINSEKSKRWERQKSAS